MVNNFPLEPLGKYASIQGGFAFKSSDFKDFGVAILKIRNIRLRDVDTSELEYVDPEVAKSVSRYFCKYGDLLMSMTGSGPQAPNSVVGRLARFTGPSDTYLFNQRIGRIVIKEPSQLNPRFLFYVLTQPDYQWSLVSIATGSANQANISAGQIESLEIPVPPPGEQRAIARILGTLDDKIELNRRMNETLEAMARAIFKSWLVDFGPVRAKAEGRDPGLPKHIADLFPDRFEESELGEIPAGWSIKTIGDVAERVGMGPFGSSIKVETFVPDGIPIISGQHLNGFMLEDNKFNFISVEHAERLNNSNVRRGDVVFTHAGNIGQAAFIPECSKYERYVISQRQFFMRCKLSQVTPSFIAFYFNSPEGRHQLLANTSSSGVPSIARPVTYLRTIKLVIPPKSILEEFGKLTQPLLLRFRRNFYESDTLATLRDALLPKLLSGDVRLRPWI
jgi:type I restriction enzyme S subunit